MNRMLPLTLESHRRSVYAVCLKILRHPQDAEDATQEALVEAAREAQAVRDPERFEAWLQRVAIHTALDVLRRRRTRERHEGRVLPLDARARDDRAEALYAALASLPEDDRRVLIEHFVQQKTLREMARPAGCSEVAVWKRIGRAKLLLRDALVLTGSSALLAFLPREGFGATAFPTGAVKTVLVAAAVIVVMAGVAARARLQRKESPMTPVGALAVAAPRESPREEGGAAAPKVEAAREAATLPAARRPYPYRFPPPSWSPALATAWQALRTKRVTIDFQNTSLEAVLAELTRQTAVRFAVVSEISGEILSMKITDIVLDGCLRFMLGPRQKAFELLEDGAIRIDRQERVSGRFWVEAREIDGALRSLEEIRERFANGWNGTDGEVPGERLEAKLQVTRVISRQTDATGLDRITFLKEKTGVNIIIDAGISQESVARLLAPRTLPIEEATVEGHLARLCADSDLGFYVTPENVVLITSRNRAEEVRKQLAEDRAARAELHSRLDHRLEGALPPTMPELAEALGRALGVETRVSEKVWDSRTEVSLPPRITVREALYILAAQGNFRWGLDGRLYIVD